MLFGLLERPTAEAMMGRKLKSNPRKLKWNVSNSHTKGELLGL